MSISLPLDVTYECYSFKLVLNKSFAFTSRIMLCIWVLQYFCLLPNENQKYLSNHCLSEPGWKLLLFISKIVYPCELCISGCGWRSHSDAHRPAIRFSVQAFIILAVDYAMHMHITAETGIFQSFSVLCSHINISYLAILPNTTRCNSVSCLKIRGKCNTFSMG